MLCRFFDMVRVLTSFIRIVELSFYKSWISNIFMDILKEKIGSPTDT